MDTGEEYQVPGDLPMFSQPASQRLDPPLPEDEGSDPSNEPPSEAENPSRARWFHRSGTQTPRPDPGDTPTTIWGSTGESKPGDPKALGDLAAAVIGMAFLGAAFVVRQRRRRKLRQPSKRQLRDIGAPLGRIAARHVTGDWLNDDLTDALDAGSALAAYLAEGPMTVTDRPDEGLPANLNQEITHAA